jgi:hypothetical protein
MPLRPGFADEAITELKSIAEQAGSTRVHYVAKALAERLERLAAYQTARNPGG